ncbi:hypothetical protein [Dyella choica]|uniref:Uncharacterized protein n=1 Tax=Dyella choica TaxID=1927959 RepID=A0A3S0R5B6_9GAMM|nr:hypothetical protein [Dyella choica]RUL78229.1 hypothetical protein EKH80_05155 [Dyella choica]
MLSAPDARAATDQRLVIAMHFGDQAAAYIYNHLAADILAEANSGGDALIRQGMTKELKNAVLDALIYLGYTASLKGDDLHVSW